jgi:hypothetical protein
MQAPFVVSKINISGHVVYTASRISIHVARCMGPELCWRVYSSVSVAFRPGRSGILDMDFREFPSRHFGE